MVQRKPVNEYHVYDDSLRRIAGVDIIERDGARVVRLSAGQAAYLTDQGTIGVTPKAQLSAAASSLIKQFHGAKA
ncbi:hypothetical protein [Bradyrhizobium sp. Leo121]|uniref:hypothetical protein n=1 Tax=Bradyrhizobium sp. Leo121 TaxID=1571195 RepID=UPI00102983A4|nr:hypothetical protein [Bradyrhizobium sp. Leo121]